MDLTQPMSYTVLDVAKIVSYRVGNLKNDIELLHSASRDSGIALFLQSYDDVLREIIREKPPVWSIAETHKPTIQAVTSISITYTNGSKTITAASGFSSDHVHGFVVVVSSGQPGYGSPFRIASYTSATEMDMFDDWPFSTLARASYVVQDTIALPDNFAGLIGAYITGKPFLTNDTPPKSLTVKRPQDIEFMRNSVLQANTVGVPSFCSIDRDIGTVASHDSYTWRLSFWPTPAFMSGVRILYVKEAENVAGTSAPDSVVVPVPEDDIDVLIGGIVAKMNDASNGGEPVQMAQWRGSVLGRYLLESKNLSDENVSYPYTQSTIDVL